MHIQSHCLAFPLQWPLHMRGFPQPMAGFPHLEAGKTICCSCLGDVDTSWPPPAALARLWTVGQAICMQPFCTRSWTSYIRNHSGWTLDQHLVAGAHPKVVVIIKGDSGRCCVGTFDSGLSWPFLSPNGPGWVVFMAARVVPYFSAKLKLCVYVSVHRLTRHAPILLNAP